MSNPLYSRPTPYQFKAETFFDANRNVVRVDTEDRQVDFTSADPTDAGFAHFLASGNADGVANLPMKPRRKGVTTD